MVTATTPRPYREIIPETGTLAVNMHAGQARARRSEKRFIVICAGLQGGKTCFLPDWLHREIQTCGPGDYLAVTATFPLLDLKMLPEFLDVFQYLLKLGKYKDSDKTFEFTRQKTRIIFASATNPESIESATAKAAVLDEPGQKQFKRETHMAVIGRLSLSRGRIVYATTLYTYGWFKAELIDRALAGDPDIELIQFDSTINPAFPQAEYDRMKVILPPWLFEMRYRGRYGDKPAGMVYSSFNSAVDVVKRFPIPAEYGVHVGHDFGLNNAAAVFYAQDRHTGEFFLFDRYLPDGGKSVAERVERFREITKGMNVINRIGGNHQEEEIRQAYGAHGWPITEPVERHVAPRIQKVFGMHSQHKVKIFSDQQEYLDEKLAFSYELDDNYQPNYDKIEREAEYHLMSAEQYILSYFRPDTAEPTPKAAVVVDMRPSHRASQIQRFRGRN